MRVSEIARILDKNDRVVIIVSKDAVKAKALLREVDLLVTTKLNDAATRVRRYENGSVAYAATPGTNFRGMCIHLILVLNDVSESDVQRLKTDYFPVVSSGGIGKMIVETEEMPFLPFVDL
ncbi:hypothetical protein PP935_gp171 [Rhizobium phage RHph_N34]|uniref:Uncharacterized protein n=1 Tax=Rhizobium phage RHph_N34 TaxID=2509586 RepID=A0A7S5RA60_9CAUD|nr:hypothetical protein PP935_gp171 [Rhizobium phage RHph_N34]QIG73946.1 hypothetical protein EVC06_171 [Rhizobium phage RHph_N34]